MPKSLVMRDTRCPLCDEGEFTTLMESPDWTGTAAGIFRVVRCRRCGHRYTNPAPADESLADCYPSDYGPHQRASGGEITDDQSLLPTGESPQEAVSRKPWYLSSWMHRIPGPRWFYHWVTDTKSVWLPPEPGAGREALELGCSSGWFLCQLQERGWSPVGLDLVRAPIERARAAGLNVHLGTLDTVTFEQERFDAVFAWMVLEHVPRPRETLTRVHAVLRPGGWFAFSVPNLSSWEPIVFRQHWRGYDLPRHLQHFTIARLRRLLDQSGFQVDAIHHQPSFLYWTGSLGSLMQSAVPGFSLGIRLMQDYENNPPLPFYVALGPLAKLNAVLRQSGRITVVARKR